VREALQKRREAGYSEEFIRDFVERCLERNVKEGILRRTGPGKYAKAYRQ
jgi:hypothetical protein